ncbi:phage holin family protein [Hydromonas duriensis]|uniref:Putative membrane protein n=1 Tax=Hydromonas duriensis TaxID=1527608 RepID=A0A4R6YBV7_9BURK|nr:phage holin family protein [Hydromonas duriensis]TDR33187.1 putative membrane protein [Hydromonas duriensis]
MTKWLLLWAINTAALMALPFFFSGIHFSGWQAAFVAAAVLGLLNTIIKPIVIILTLPLQILTLGLFTLVINAAMMMLVARFTQGFLVDSFGTAFLASVVYSLISWAGASILLPAAKE